jgi:hypothetical protein
MLEELKEDFVWLDVDCEVNKPIGFKNNCDWMSDMREDGTPHDYVHFIKNTEGNKEFLKLWISVIEKEKKGSHTAFISIYKKLNFQKIPNGYVSLGLSEVISKNNYFRK